MPATHDAIVNDAVTFLIFDHLPMGVLYCDANYVIRFANKAYAELLGKRPHDIIGRNITEVIPSSRAPEVMTTGQAEMGDLCSIPGPRADQKLVVNRIPVRDAAGALVGMISQAIFNDPSELKRLSNKIEQLGHKLSQYKRRMAATLHAQYSLASLKGESASMHQIKDRLRSYARMDAPVLVLGATGTGKELAAHALHAESTRAAGPLVSINCAAIPKDLFESELFGYVRGAFSGAHHSGKMGQIELADGGTLFLDEIGDMPLQAQAKLLRVLESRTICRVGAVTAEPVDFRLIAATNRNIKDMVQAGTFREDLYYRINTFIIEIPPLRDRKEDILPLAHHFLARMGHEGVAFTPAALSALQSFEWPGNIRQLHNAILHAATMREGSAIDVCALPPEIRPVHTSPVAPCPLPQDRSDLAGILAHNEAALIENALREQGGNVTRAASALGVSRATLYEKMKKHGVHAVRSRDRQGS